MMKIKWLSRWVSSLIVIAAAILLSGCGGGQAAQQPGTKWEADKRADAHADLGISYLHRGQFDIARDELDLAISIDPNSDKAHHGKGLLFAQTGYREKAKQSLARAVRLNGDNFVAVNDYGTYLCQTDEFESGEKVLNKIVTKPDNEFRNGTYLGLGVCAYRQDKLAPARSYYKEVLRVAPALPQALLPMADIAFRQQQYLSARAFVERFVTTGAISEQVLVIGARTEIKMGDDEKARQYARELRRAFPSSNALDEFRPLLVGG